MSLPHLVLVPGLWEGGFVFERMIPLLDEKKYATSIAILASTGVPSAPAPAKSPSMYDDEDAIHAVIEPLVDSGKEVLVVAHSAGGYLGAGATEGLCKPKRQELGKPGGVIGFVFLCAGIAPLGYQHIPERPFCDYQVSFFWQSFGRLLIFSRANLFRKTRASECIA